MKNPSRELEKADFEQLSEFRYQMRRFERFSEQAAQSEGITPLQYLLLVHIKGYPQRDWATIGELAKRLQAAHHGVVALVSRCEVLGLVKRKVSETDRRQVEVHLQKLGEKTLAKLAALHRAELKSLEGAFNVLAARCRAHLSGIRRCAKPLRQVQCTGRILRARRSLWVCSRCRVGVGICSSPRAAGQSERP